MRNTFRNSSGTIIITAILIIGLGIFYIPNYLYREDMTVVVNRVDMQQEVHGTDGDISTSYHYRVYTDKGLFEIDQTGIFFAHPELIGQVSAGDTVSISSLGYDLSKIGIYRKIVAINK